MLRCWHTIKNNKLHKCFIVDVKKSFNKTFDFSNCLVGDISKNIGIIKKLLESQDKVIIANYKRHCRHLGSVDTVVYDVPYDDVELILKSEPELWHKVRAEAAEVYQIVENRGVYVGYKNYYPMYEMDVFSGRSRTTGFSVQGCDNSYPIQHPHKPYSCFISFDWISADARIGGIISGDELLLSTFKSHDPYYYIAEQLGDINARELCKIEFNRAVNGLDDANEILNIFPKYKKWISGKILELRANGHIESILGRKFYSDGSEKGYRRAFNSMFQGSVAHAMHCSVKKIYDKFGDIMLTEQHDSLVVCISVDMLPSVVPEISEIMYRPFSGILENVTMPLRIEIGKSWNNYKPYKEIR